MNNLPAKIDNQISICPHPLRAERHDMAMPMGLTIEQMIRYAQPDARLRPHAHVHVNGRYIDPSQWPYVRPFAEDAVEIRMVPRGGGGDKNPLRTILTIVVMAVATYTGQWYAYSYLGLTGAAAAGVAAGTSAAIMTVGRLGINAIAPPPQQDMPDATGADVNDQPTYSIENARNRARRYQPIRKIIGRHRIVPDLAAEPYTEVVGNDQYLRMLFCWGYGPLQIEDLRIGETPLSNYDEVEVETRTGKPDDDPITLYPGTVNENALSIEIAGDSGWSTRTTEPDVDEISLDLSFPRGLVEFDDRGNRQTRVVELEVQYAPTGTSDWSVAGDTAKSIDSQNVSVDFRYWENRYIQIDKYNGRVFAHKRLKGTSHGIAKLYTECTDYHTTGRVSGCAEHTLRVDDIRSSDNITGLAPSKVDESTVSVDSGSLYVPYVTFRQATTSQLRKSVRFDPGARGQYDVRVRRVTGNSSSAQVRDASYWTVLRSFRNEDSVKMDNVAITAVRIKATDQLNGVISELNGICTSVLPLWNSTDGVWEEQATRRIEAGYRTLLQGNGMGKPLADSRIDLTGLQDAAEYWEDEGFVCDLVIEKRKSVRQHLNDIASTGRASVSVVDGDWGVVVDNPRSTIAQHVTPRNSWGYTGSKEFDEVPHAFKVRFTNEQKGYRQDTRIVYRDGYDESNATEFEEMQLPGVTDPDLAWRHGRYHLAVALLRPENHSFKMDPEHLVANRGDLIKFAHTVPLFGVKSARVKSIADTDSDGDIEQVTVDDIFPMDSGKTYFVRFRLGDGTSLLKEVETSIGENNTVTFVTPEPEADAPEEGDLCMFGETGLESVDMIIKSVEPTNDLSAKITCVDAAPAIHDADTGTIPVFDSQITEPAFLDPPKPNIQNVRSDETVLLERSDGSLDPRILIDFSIPAGYRDLVAQFERQYRESSEEGWTSLPDLGSDAKSFFVSDVESTYSYDIRIRSISKEGEASPWAEVSSHVVIGKTTPPPNVQTLYTEGEGSKLIWAYPNAPKDFEFFEIRHAQGAVRNWGLMNVFGSGFQGPPVDVSTLGTDKTWTFAIKAVDTAGNYSEDAAFVIRGLGDRIRNIILDKDYHPDWPGTIVNGSVADGDLVPDTSSDIWIADMDQVVWRNEDTYEFWAVQYKKMVYTTQFTPTVRIGKDPGRLVIDLSITSPDHHTVEIRPRLPETVWYSETDRTVWVGGDDSYLWWDATPGEWLTWQGALDILNQTYDLRLTTYQTTNAIRAESLILKLDVPDVTEFLNDVNIPSDGARLPVTKDFDNIKNVRLILQDDGGDAVTLKIADKATSGPYIYAYNANNNKTSAVIDAKVDGY